MLARHDGDSLESQLESASQVHPLVFDQSISELRAAIIDTCEIGSAGNDSDELIFSVSLRELSIPAKMHFAASSEYGEMLLIEFSDYQIPQILLSATMLLNPESPDGRISVRSDQDHVYDEFEKNG